MAGIPERTAESDPSLRTPTALCLGGIAIGVAEFLPVGLLPDIARAMRITIPQAGYLLSAYATGVVVGAPLLVALGLKYPPQRVLIAFMALFGACNALFALAHSYRLLVLSRFLSGLPHGAFFGLGAVVAARLAPRGQQAGAVAVMFAGLTVANVLLVPAGTYVGHHASWRLPFAIVSILSFLTAWAISKQIPSLSVVPERRVAVTLQEVIQPRFWPLIGISAIGTGGLYAWISYIAPLVTEVTGLAHSEVAVVMILAGVGMAIGNWAGGRLADRFHALNVVCTVLFAMLACTLLVSGFAHHKVATLVLTVVTGAVAFAIIAPLQMLMLSAAPGAKMMASALMQSTANVGNALGAYLGGLGIAYGYGFASPEIIGAGLVAVGLACALMLKMRSSQAAGLAPVGAQS